MAKIRILLINPYAIEPPVFPTAFDYLFVADDYKTKYKFELLDFSDPINRDKDKYINKIIKYDPQIILWTIRAIDDATYISQVFYIEKIKKIFDEVKKIINENCKMILGGVGFSIMPKEILEYLDADYGIVGDGEYATEELINKIVSGYPPDEKIITNYVSPENYKNIKRKRDIIGDEHSDEQYDYNDYFEKGGIIAIETKRGCSLNCSFCIEPKVKGACIRLRDPDSVIDEIEILLKKGVDFFFFCDSEFNNPKEHAVEICSKIKDKNLNDKIRWTAYFKPTGIDTEFIELLNKSGCWGITMSVGSLSNTMLKEYNEKHNAEKIIEVCKLCDNSNMKYCISLLLGGPGETEATIKESFTNLRKISPTPLVNIMVGVRIYPGTSIFEQAKNENLITDKKEDLLKPYFYNPDNFIENLISKAKEEIKYRYIHSYYLPDNGGLIISSDLLKSWYEKGNKGPYWGIWNDWQKTINIREKFFKNSKVIFASMVLLDKSIYTREDVYYENDNVGEIIRDKIDKHVELKKDEGNYYIWLDLLKDKILELDFNIGIKKNKEELKIHPSHHSDIGFDVKKIINGKLNDFYNDLEGYYDDLISSLSKKVDKNNIMHIIVPIVFRMPSFNKLVLFVNLIKLVDKEQYLEGADLSNYWKMFYEDIIFHFRNEYEGYFYKELISHAQHSAISAIMARNVSHNIGSHVLANLVTSVSKWECDKDDPDCKKRYDLLSNFIAYLQTRMDFLARVSTQWPYTIVPIDFLNGILLPFIRQKYLLDYISLSEGLNNNENKIRIFYNDDELTIDKEGKLIGEYFSNYFISVPESIVGIHAVYTIFENFIRNSAKHGYTDKNGKKDLEIHIKIEKGTETLCKFQIWDNVSQGKEGIDSLVSEMQNKILKEKLIDKETGKLNEKCKGLKEMKIAIAFLNRMKPEDIDNDLEIIKVCKSPINTLCYEFNVESPKFLMIVDKNHFKSFFQNGINLTTTLNFSAPISFQFLVLSELDNLKILIKENENEKRDWIPFRTIILGNLLHSEILPKRFRTLNLSNISMISDINENIDIEKSEKLIITIYKEWLKSKMGGERYSLKIYLGNDIEKDSLLFNQWDEMVEEWESLIDIKILANKEDIRLEKKENTILLLRHGGDGLSNHGYINENKGKYFYYEKFEIGSPILDVLLNKTNNIFYRNLVIAEILEGVFMKVVIIDERLAENVVKDDNLKEALMLMHIIIPTHVKIDNVSIDLVSNICNEKKVEITVSSEGEVEITNEDGKVIGVEDIDILSIHQGIVDKFPESIKYSPEIENWFKKVKNSVDFVVVHSGRGKPENIAKNVKFIEFSPIQWYTSFHTSKTFLVQTLLSIAGESK